MTAAFAERYQLTIAIITLAPAIIFIVLYGREKWWRSWFGISLMLMAVAILGACCSAILFRIFGADYLGRPYFLVFTSSLTFVAMTARTFVLAAAQMGDRRAAMRGDTGRHDHR